MATPLIESMNLATIPIRTCKKLLWDAANMTVTNVPEANALVKPFYREGWEL